jgi:hypothetical protein
MSHLETPKVEWERDEFYPLYGGRTMAVCPAKRFLTGITDAVIAKIEIFAGQNHGIVVVQIDNAMLGWENATKMDLFLDGQKNDTFKR